MQRETNPLKIHESTELGARVDRELDDDRRFFERHPHRNYRLRRIFPAEYEEFAVRSGGALPPRDMAFVAVEQVRPGARLRVVYAGRFDEDDDDLDTIEDETCREAFLWVAPPWLQELRQKMLDRE